jgi:hypothetical protein
MRVSVLPSGYSAVADPIAPMPFLNTVIGVLLLFFSHAFSVRSHSYLSGLRFEQAPHQGHDH